MTHTLLCRLVGLTVLALALPAAAWAQGGPEPQPFGLGSLFGQGNGQQAPPPQQPGGGDDINLRLDRIENWLRQMTGNIEELQHRNQQLEEQVQQLQAALQGGARPLPGRPPMAPAPSAPAPGAGYAAPAPSYGQAAPAYSPPPAAPASRDVFDPAANPNAPGAPRPLGSPGSRSEAAPSYGAPPNAVASARNDGIGTRGMPEEAGAGARAGQQVATLPPSATPRDEFDLAYGYLKRKDYALAEQGFRAFTQKYPNDRLAGDAQYWLGESLFQHQSYRDAADVFVAMVKKYDKSAKAPDAYLRLGQSLVALHEKELACATLAEVGRKYPRASNAVKQAADREQKRAGC